MKTLPLPTCFLNLRHLPPFSNVNNINNLLLCRHSSPLILRRRTLIIESMAASTSSDLNQDNSVSTAADVNNDVFQLIQAHQNKASRLTPVKEVKTFLCHSLRGVLSTVSMKHEGYPSGSMVDFDCDAYGAPILAVSDLAVHTKNLMANPKCSLLVSNDPQDRTELVVTDSLCMVMLFQSLKNKGKKFEQCIWASIQMHFGLTLATSNFFALNQRSFDTCQELQQLC